MPVHDDEAYQLPSLHALSLPICCSLHNSVS